MKNREHYRLRRIFRSALLAALVLLGAAILLGHLSSQHMKDIIREQYTEQQLFLARGAAAEIEKGIHNALSDLILLNAMPAIQYANPESYETLLLSTMPILNRDNIIELLRVDREGKVLFVANEQGIAMRHFGPAHGEAAAFLSWATVFSNRGKTMITGIRPKDPAGDRKQMVMDMIIPTYEDAVDTANIRPSHRFSGYVRATLDVNRLLQRTLPSIKSGKTGYAWVIDSTGTFLYHPETTFVGENAFDIRSKRNPNISFKDINQIQREDMLRGKEGSGVYMSGWHRDVFQPMEKLLAYSPIRIPGTTRELTWSVAVVVPVREIEGVISTVYQRQILFQGLIVLTILLATGVVLLYQLRWSTLLEHEVAVKTEDIRKSSEQLEHSETKYRTLVESAEDMIFSLDNDGIIQTANQHMSRLFGFSSPMELVNQSLFRFLPKDQAEIQLRTIREVARSGKVARLESAFTIHDQDFWFHIHYMPLRGSDPKKRIILGIARDITEHKNLEKQLMNTEKLASLGTMAAGVAHEINNPLGIMLGFCDLLLDKIPPGTMEYNDLKTIERHGLHCKAIVESLLSFARLSGESEEYSNLNENIEEILSMMRHTLSLNNIEATTDLCPHPLITRGDSRGIQQVLLNLITNAVQSMPQGGRLHVSTTWNKAMNKADLTIQDTGEGIPRQFREKVFDPFFTTKKVGEGTGLGLSVSYGIITKYGGDITFESATATERPGRSGTTFTITLPVHDQPERDESPGN
ncbi:MAG TPA: sensor histidine kinase [Desulfonatronum sp.]|nr:sensor histidine kinase [Desulfonatronum sp.]